MKGLNNILSNNRPDLCKEWDCEKNGDLTPDKVTYSSHKKAWWKCNRDHSWGASINDRTNHASGCPYCNGKKVDSQNCLAFINPKLAKEWHPTQNGDLTPYNVTANNNKRAWWICSMDKNHQWQATIASRNDSHGCPYCSGHKMSQKNCFCQQPDL